MTTKQRQSKKTRREATIASLFEAARAEGRAIMTREEFLLAASVAGISHDRIEDALLGGELRKGISGYWLTEAPDPGAVAVMRAALRETATTEEA